MMWIPGIFIPNSTYTGEYSERKVSTDFQWDTEIKKKKKNHVFVLIYST